MEASRQAERMARFRKAGAREDQLEPALAGRVVAGMSKELVHEILGAPLREDKRVTELGTFVLWFYSGSTIEFAAGRVSAVRR